MTSQPVVISGGSFAIAANGFADGPSQALEQFLLAADAREVTVIQHPLVPEGPTEHRIVSHRDGRVITKSTDLRIGPPVSFALDPFVPLRLPKVDGWFGFNCLATTRGLVQRRLGRARRVVHWNVDFVAERFGNRVLNKAYEGIDRWCCRSADGRVDLSQAALDARIEHYGLDPASDKAVVIPMGTWFDQVPKTSAANFAARRVVFLGHLVERMGVPVLIDALEILHAQGFAFHADIIGGGPLLGSIRNRLATSPLADQVTAHGFVPEFADIERLLSKSTVAVAPYERDPDSFTRFADPGKLKAYLGAALPIILTDVPPNAYELAREAGAQIVLDDGREFAQALAALMTDETQWQRRRSQAESYAWQFDWNAVLETGLGQLGFVKTHQTW